MKKIIWAGTKTETNKSIIPFALFVPYMEKARRNTRRVAGKRKIPQPSPLPKKNPAAETRRKRILPNQSFKRLPPR